MSNEFNNGQFNIRFNLNPGDDYPKPFHSDIASICSLPFLAEECKVWKIFDLLIKEEYQAALKFAAYNSDEKTESIKYKLCRFLTLGLGIHLAFCYNRDVNRELLLLHKRFISGIEGMPFSDRQIVELVQADIPLKLNVDFFDEL